jgi:hypothetical protein
MESYRYRLTNQADFEKFVGWLIENKFNFFTQHNYIPSAGDHVYHVTVTAEASEVNVFAAVRNFIEAEIRSCAFANTDTLYETLNEITDDAYADPATLREVLVSTLDLNEELNTQIEESKEDKEKMVEALESVKESKKFYQNNYLKAIEDNKRIKERIRAMALLMDSIFPKD